MKLHVPESLDEAIALLGRYEEARCLAGGQTLVAMLNANLLFPDALISLRRVDELRGITREKDGSVVIGAMTTHRTVAEFEGFTGAQAILRVAASRIAHPPIRNRGTIGGAIAHADPAGDFPTALAAAEAVVEIAGPGGRRSVSAREFFQDYLTTVVAPDEIVTRIRLPPGPQDARVHYDKLARIDGDLAIIAVAVVLAMGGSRCTYARLVLGACGPTPVYATAADAALVGRAISPESIGDAVAALAPVCRPFDDFRATARYRQYVMPRLVRRAILAAAGGV